MELISDKKMNKALNLFPTSDNKRKDSRTGNGSKDKEKSKEQDKEKSKDRDRSRDREREDDKDKHKQVLFIQFCYRIYDVTMHLVKF